MMSGKVQKWGNSQGLRLPKQLLSLAELAVGDEVEFVVGDRQITVRKAAGAKYNLADLVARIPKDYEAHEENFGPRVGKEAW